MFFFFGFFSLITILRGDREYFVVSFSSLRYGSYYSVYCSLFNAIFSQLRVFTDTQPQREVRLNVEQFLIALIPEKIPSTSERHIIEREKPDIIIT